MCVRVDKSLACPRRRVGWQSDCLHSWSGWSFKESELHWVASGGCRHSSLCFCWSTGYRVLFSYWFIGSV